jgi:lysophospholipid acyltransferase (LPLAT)-like uncharacterized protein
VAFAAGAGCILVRLLGLTWRYRLRNREIVEALRAQGRPILFALWHGELLALLWLHRRERMSVLISQHSDGEVIARIARSLGYEAVRGSTSRGGVRAALELVQVLEARREVAITPDGPRGPRHEFAPGTLAIAQRSGAPLVCVRANASRGWHLRTWDRFVIPKPFARITVGYSEPEVVRAATGRDAEREAPRFAQLMTQLSRQAGGSE